MGLKTSKYVISYRAYSAVTRHCRKLFEQYMTFTVNYFPIVLKYLRERTDRTNVQRLLASFTVAQANLAG